MCRAKYNHLNAHYSALGNFPTPSLSVLLLLSKRYAHWDSDGHMSTTLNGSHLP